MKIRGALKKDFKEIANIMIEEFSKPPFKEKSKTSSVIKSLDFYYKIGNIFVAIQDERVVGLIVFKVEQWWEGPVIIIEDLAVKENFKKQNIGRKLMDKVEKYAKNVKASSINLVTNGKSSAIKFYIKQGYKKEKDRVFLRKSLKEY